MEKPRLVNWCQGCHRRQSEEKLASGRRVRAMSYDLTECAQSCVEAYLDLAGGSSAALKHVSSLCLTESDPGPKGEQSKGRLGPIAARVLMQILDAASAVRLLIS